MALPAVLPFQPQFNYPNNKLYQYEAYPVLLTCNFIVDSTNGNGLGIRSLKGSGVANVFMHTSATPAVGNYAVLNPNPAVGGILVQLQNQFSRLLSVSSSIISPVGSSSTSTVANVPSIITVLGTATVAQWVAKGFPVGVTPSLGAAFIASASGVIGGSAQAAPASVSGITCIEGVGDPNATLQNANIYQNGGATLLMQALGATNSSTTTLIAKAPADGTVISLAILLSNSSVQVNGQ